VCGDAALYFDPLSVDAIVAAMRRFLTEDALCQQLRRTGLARAAGFGWGPAAVVLRGALPVESRA